MQLSIIDKVNGFLTSRIDSICMNSCHHINSNLRFSFFFSSSSSTSIARLHSPIHASYHSSFFRHIFYQINISPRKSKSNRRLLRAAYVQERNPIQSILPFEIRRPSSHLPCSVNSPRRGHVFVDRADLNVSNCCSWSVSDGQVDLHQSMWLS